MTAVEVGFKDIGAQETENNTEICTSNTKSQHLYDLSSTEDDHNFGDGIHISILKCAGHLNYLVDCFNDCKQIIAKWTQSDKLSVLALHSENINTVLRTKENCL